MTSTFILKKISETEYYLSGEAIVLNQLIGRSECIELVEDNPKVIKQNWESTQIEWYMFNKEPLKIYYPPHKFYNVYMPNSRYKKDENGYVNWPWSCKYYLNYLSYYDIDSESEYPRIFNALFKAGAFNELGATGLHFSKDPDPKFLESELYENLITYVKVYSYGFHWAIFLKMPIENIFDFNVEYLKKFGNFKNFFEAHISKNKKRFSELHKANAFISIIEKKYKKYIASHERQTNHALRASAAGY